MSARARRLTNDQGGPPAPNVICRPLTVIVRPAVELDELVAELGSGLSSSAITTC